MSTTASTLRQVILLKFLQQKRSGATLAQIGEHMAEALKMDAAKYLQRTFQRDKDALIKNYQVEIAYNHALKVYRIINSQASFVMETIKDFQMLNAVLDEEELPGQVIFETHRSKGIGHFKKLLKALKTNTVARFDYQAFSSDEPKRCLAEPYVLKEFKGRWYLLAMDRADQETKVFTLDKITGLELSSKKFSYPLFADPQQKFKHCFGIILPQPVETVQQVILSFDPWLNKHLKDQPLHATQTQLTDNANEYRTSLDVYVTYDLVMKILSYGENVKVIAPESLVGVVRERYKMAQIQYK